MKLMQVLGFREILKINGEVGLNPEKKFFKGDNEV